MATFFAWLLMIVGGLWTVLCGACTLFFLVASASSPGGEAAGLGVLSLVLGIVGVVPGAIVLLLGLLLLRSTRRAQQPPETFT